MDTTLKFLPLSITIENIQKDKWRGIKINFKSKSICIDLFLTMFEF